MYYQTQLLPVDDADGFLMAIHHYPHTIGGEDTRETAYARFAVGRAGSLNTLLDVTAQCLPSLPASPSRARYLRQLAQGQGEMARSGNGAASMADYYAANERSMLHAAELAGRDGVRVPRRVFASRAGKVMMAFEPSLMETSREGLPGMIRLLDLQSDARITEWKSTRAPLNPPGKNVERFSSVHLGRPLALSDDGERVLLHYAADPRLPLLVECRLDAELTALAPGVALRCMAIVGCKEGWIALSDAKALWLGSGLNTVAECRLPRGALPSNVDWPLWQNRPMAFLAQIDLAEAHAVQAGLRLPARGCCRSFSAVCQIPTPRKTTRAPAT